MFLLKVVLPLNKFSKLLIRLTFHVSMGPYTGDVNAPALISACKAALVRNGLMEGAFVGDLVGSFEGASVGSSVGCGVGWGVGELVEGAMDGAWEGDLEGALDGIWDGLELGRRQA
jgi:hypothetical protein